MDIVETRRENLRRWVAANGTPVKERSFFSQLQKDASFGERVARRLEQQYKMGAGYLDRSADADTTSSKVPFDENVVPAPMGLRPVPVISSVQAGALRDMETPYQPGDGYAYEYTDQDLSAWAFALDVEGLSMAPDFRPGDRIIVDPEISPNPGDFVIARNGSEQATFKKYRPRGIDAAGNMVFELVPLNDDYPTLRSDTEQLTVIGVVTEHRKKLRRS
ncbi:MULTISPECIES: LexA family transcriptional regulator [unclassified Massilia]|uniref:LexA family protein n=1 Tax=unclassified Massilia TaxID=2609279 RepID=UPI00177E670B|nr:MULTISPECIES: S24 family peptidase [unclassified Massilia]MBD8531473.1 S24 family peptidase [Massilia sp. CFBP 13647]MBD8673731.1 S24 family peptidase [Massilia sp. CFBP 13721]